MFTTVLLGFVIAAPDSPGGWPELFPELTNYTRKFEPLVVAKGEKPETYSQSAKYDWNGGRFETITVTLARDPAFKEKYSAEAVKKGKLAAEVLEINKKPAYLWSPDEGDGIQKVKRQLVIVLADDKILMLEQ